MNPESKDSELNARVAKLVREAIRRGLDDLSGSHMLWDLIDELIQEELKHSPHESSDLWAGPDGSIGVFIRLWGLDEPILVKPKLSGLYESPCTSDAQRQEALEGAQGLRIFAAKVLEEAERQEKFAGEQNERSGTGRGPNPARLNPRDDGASPFR